MEESVSRRKSNVNRKKLIMDAAMKVFSEKGFERATTKAIAAEAGVAEGTIFIYFSTKRDLLISCFQKEVIEPLPELFQNESESDEEIIRAFLRNRFALIKKHYGMLKVTFSEALFNTDMQQEMYERIFSKGFTEVSKYLTRRIESGAFRKIDPMTVTLSLLGQVMINTLILAITGADPDEILNEEKIDTLATLFLNGMKNQ